MAVYDQDNEKNITGSQGSSSGAGSEDSVGSSDQSPTAEANYKTPEQLNDAESSPIDGQPDTQKQLTEEDELNNTLGKGWWKPNKSKKKGKGRFSRRQKVLGGTIGSAVLGGAFLGFTLFSGPGQFLHFAQLLQRFHFISDEEFMNGRVGRIIRYARTANSPERRNMGFWGNKVANRYELKLRDSGFSPEYRDGRLEALSIDPDSPHGRSILGELQANGADIPDPSVDADGNRRIRIDLSNSSARQRRRILGGVVDTLGLGKISSTLSKRLLRVRAGVDFHPLKNITRAADESFFQYARKVRDKRRAQRTQGVDTTARRTDTKDSDPDGEKNPDADRVAQDAADQANEITEGLDGKSPTPDIDARAAKIKGNLAKGAGVVGVVTLTCGIYNLDKALPDIQYQQILLPLLRTGMDIIAMASQLMYPFSDNKDTNNDEVGVVSLDFYDEETESSWRGARSIQAELEDPLTGPDMPDSAKPNRDATPAFFDTISSVVEGVAGGVTACAAVGTTTVGWVIDIASWAFTASGPTGFIGQAVIDLAIGVATSQFVDDLVRWLVNAQVAPDAAGALLGNYANYGALLAANDNAISHGGTALSPKEVAQIDLENRKLIDNRYREKSFFARYFDTSEPSSLVAKALYENNSFNNAGGTLASVFNIPSAILSRLGSILMPSTNAAENNIQEPYDYGFPEYGFSLQDQEDPRVEDPYENASLVEPRLKELNDKYGDCFSMTIDPETGALKSGETKRYDQIDEKLECSDGSTDLLRYRFYLADTTAQKTLLCYESLDETACEELGFSNDVPISSSSGGQAGAQIEGDPYTDSSGVNCAAGTEDLGLNTGYAEGAQFTVRLCALNNLPSVADEDNPGGFYTEGANGRAVVNSKVSGAWQALVNDATADGVRLKAESSFRTYEHQEKIWIDKKKNRALAAPPGFSSHQSGVAIDFLGIEGFNESAQDCTSRVKDLGNPAWEWLFNNAEKYGFKQYSAEAWHWDALPVSNRCGVG